MPTPTESPVYTATRQVRDAVAVARGAAAEAAAAGERLGPAYWAQGGCRLQATLQLRNFATLPLCNFVTLQLVASQPVHFAT